MKGKQSLASQSPGKNKYFVYTGNAYPHKNLGRLIDAIILLNNRSKKKAKLKISSSRNIFTLRLESLIKEKGAGKYVELVGYITDSRLPRLYKDSIAFVFPTLSEGFGLPPKEAIEAGTIAIISKIPVLKEVYDDSAFYFDPNDSVSMVLSMEKVMNLTELERKKRITYAQNFLKKYSWHKMATETLKIYEEAVK